MLPLANIFQPLIDVANSVLTFFHDTVGVGWGVSIILLTIVTRLAILPLSLKQIRSMRSLQAHQPEIKKIQEKYKDDRQRMQREQMALFQEHGVNPLSACLPLVFQFPVFIALYALLRSSEFKAEVGNTGWLFVPDLTAHPTGSVMVVLIVLSVLSTFALLFFNPSPTTSGGASQKYLMAGAFSLVTVFLIPNAPAGIAVYFIASGVWQMMQQGVIRIVWPLPPVPTPEEVRATKAPPPPPRKRKRRK